MAVVATICGVVLIAGVLWEGFETVILPRRVTRRRSWQPCELPSQRQVSSSGREKLTRD
jgi:hypothetical protein